MLTEPALTNIGIVLADPGFHEQGPRALPQIRDDPGDRRDSRAELRPGGYTAAHGLEPDSLTMGKPIGGGIPTAPTGPATSSPTANVDDELLG